MRSIMKKWTNLLASALLLFCISCNEMDKYYDNERHSTAVSVGNAWDYLEKQGNFTSFLACVEKAGYKSLVSGTGLATIFAPDDAAFQKYLQRHGWSSIDNIPADVLDNMVSYHLLYYSFSSSRFIEYRPLGVDATDRYAGLYHKFRTHSRDAITFQMDETVGVERKVYRFEKYIPVLTPAFFNYYETELVGSHPNPVRDYNFFFPKETYGDACGWTSTGYVEGGDPYFRVANAGVKEYDIITDNGYLYVIDDVVEPLKTIYQSMKDNDNLTEFAKAYDRFKNLIYDVNYTQDYGLGDSLFMYSHRGVYPAEMEWPTNVSTSLDNLTGVSYTVMAPDNSVFNQFFQTYWEPYYNSFEDVKYVPLLSLMGEQCVAHSRLGSMGLCLPSEIENGQVVTAASGEVVNLNLGSDIEQENSAFCSNGLLYGVNTIRAPRYFSYVTAPAFLNPQYNMFLLLMQRAGLFDLYTTEGQTFYAFYPTDQILKSTESSGGSALYLNYDAGSYFGDERVYFLDGEQVSTLNASASSRLVRTAIADREISLGNDRYIYRTSYDRYNYLYREGDKIFSPYSFYQYYGLAPKNAEKESYNADNYVLKCKEFPVNYPIDGGAGNGSNRVANGYVFALEGATDNVPALTPNDSPDALFQFITYNEELHPHELSGNTTSGQARNFETLLAVTASKNETGGFIVYDWMKQIAGESVTGWVNEKFIIFVPCPDAVEALCYKSGGPLYNPLRPLWASYPKYLMNLFVSVPQSQLYTYPVPGDPDNSTWELSSYKVNTVGDDFTKIILKNCGDHLEASTLEKPDHVARVINPVPYIFNDCAIYILDNYLDFGADNTTDATLDADVIKKIRNNR